MKTIKIILARFKFGDLVAICRIDKFSSLPTFVLIRYLELHGVHAKTSHLFNQLLSRAQILLCMA